MAEGAAAGSADAPVAVQDEEHAQGTVPTHSSTPVAQVPVEGGSDAVPAATGEELELTKAAAAASSDTVASRRGATAASSKKNKKKKDEIMARIEKYGLVRGTQKPIWDHFRRYSTSAPQKYKMLVVCKLCLEDSMFVELVCKQGSTAPMRSHLKSSLRGHRSAYEAVLAKDRAVLVQKTYARNQ
jgi:hypothetical protein